MIATRQQVYNAGLYCRLSVDDLSEGESGSIQTQKAILADFCKQNGLNIVDYYVDDGVSGTSFDRPGFQQMIADVHAGRINTVVTKDLSRFGRNHVEAGMYQNFFVEQGVRFVTAHDGVDTLKKRYDISVPIRNIINDFYARDVSEKTKAAKEARARQGLFLGSKAPYGYRKDPDNRHKLIVDEEVSDVVRRIFHMAAEGKSTNRIAKALTSEGILTPTSYHKENHPEYDKQNHFSIECRWSDTTVKSILQNPVYLGKLCHCKVVTRGINSKHVPQDPEDWIIVEDTHQPLVEYDTWEMVQRLLSQRRRDRKNGERQMFAGLLYCADCGSALSFCTIKRKTMPDDGQYKCWYYMRHGKDYCSAHYITLHQITELVLTDIRKHAQMASRFKKEYLQWLQASATEKEKARLKQEAKEVARMHKRASELDSIIKSLVEKNALGKIPDERFFTLFAEYEQEQKNLAQRLGELEARIQKAQEDAQNAERFVALVEKYTGLTELNTKILNELIHRINVHEKQVDEAGNTTRCVEIIYNFVGFVEIDL